MSTGTRFADGVVVITGSTRGIGAATAHRFAQEGASVVTGRSTDEGETVVSKIVGEGGEARFIQADLRKTDDIENLVERTVTEFDSIDVLVNNAAVQTSTSVTTAELEDWSKVLETDFRSYWLCAKKAVSHMDSGSIINVSSNHAYHTMPDHFPYNAVKAGINGMTRAMALDLGPDVRVNTVNPGWVAVDRTVSGMSVEERSELESIHPVGRIGEPGDVAGAIAFLASEDAAFITGTSLLVDGGRGAVMQDYVLPDYRNAN